MVDYFMGFEEYKFVLKDYLKDIECLYLVLYFRYNILLVYNFVI